jgi:hypothetical protein
LENIFSNPVVLKVQNGTQRSDVNLCLSCRMALHIQSAQSSNEVLLCSASGQPPLRISEPVGKCSGYLDKNQPTLYDLRDIAWTLMTDKGGRSLGFHSPEELRERNESKGEPPSVPGFGR